MDKDTSEIIKLTERISKDPKSKLFVPLAEEYKKIGDIEMAIHVLSEGLKNNPSYVTARSLLGRLLYENGDLVAAQKEFEEVVKAIPDNLLAQRKLGDLYSFQKNPTEALKHYKIALALNPDDKSCAELVSKLEESLDLKEKPEGNKGHLFSPIPGALESERPSAPDISVPVAPTLQVSSATTQQPQEEVAPPRKAEPSVHAFELKVEKAAEASIQQMPSESAYKEHLLSPMPAQQDLLAEANRVSESFAAPSEMEEPEEVLVVEPIEEEETPEEPLSAEETFPSEKISENISSSTETSKTDISVFVSELIDDESRLFGKQEPSVAVSSEAPSESAGTVQVTAFEPGIPDKQAADESDDFTTDTLAELYIAQGFYEKAIDIYERMMADHPDNSGLKEKLERVRAMALVNPPEEYASTVAAKEPGEITKSTKLSGEQETSPFQDIKEFKPEAETEELNQDVTEVPTTDFSHSFLDREVLKTTRETHDIKPQEYMPLDMLPREAKEEKANSTPRQSIAAKKETIDRLEMWLKNIKKEK